MINSTSSTIYTAYFKTPHEAETAFYNAFEEADIGRMMAVWRQVDYAECIHPLSDRLNGHKLIKESWQHIFRNSTPMRFNIVRQSTLNTGNIAVHVVYEEIYTDENDLAFVIIATNIYEQTNDGWHMVLHHASPAPHPPAVMKTPSDCNLH